MRYGSVDRIRARERFSILDPSMWLVWPVSFFDSSSCIKTILGLTNEAQQRIKVAIQPIMSPCVFSRNMYIFFEWENQNGKKKKKGILRTKRPASTPFSPPHPGFFISFTSGHSHVSGPSPLLWLCYLSSLQPNPALHI